MDQNNVPKSDNLKHALCYVPLMAFIIFFIENNKSPVLKKHIKYGGALFGVYFILNFIVGWALGGILFLIYIIVAGIYGYKAYTGEDFDIEHIDKAEKEIKNRL